MSSVIASQLVLSAEAGDADPDLVVSQTAELLHARSRDALAQHVGDLRCTRTDEIDSLPLPPLALLRSVGTLSSAAARIIAAPATGWTVLLRAAESDAVTAQYAARAAAALLARHADGIGIDLDIPRVWPRLDPAADPDRTADWFVFARVPGGDAVSTETRGLARFGLPELRVVEIPASDIPAWDAALTGLAHRLVAEASAPLPDRLELELRDIAAGYAEPIDPADPTLCRRTTVALTDADGVVDVTGSVVADLFTG